MIELVNNPILRRNDTSEHPFLAPEFPPVGFGGLSVRSSIPPKPYTRFSAPSLSISVVCRWCLLPILQISSLSPSPCAVQILAPFGCSCVCHSLWSRYPFVKESVDGNDFTQSLSLLPQKSGASRKEPRAIAVNPVLLSVHHHE